MKRSFTRAVTMTAAATALSIGAMAPLAGADPWVEFRSDGEPLVDGGTLDLGQPLEITGGACEATEGAVMGQFVSAVDDPAFVGPDEQWKIELPVDETGAFEWDLTIGAENDLGTFWARWYCASSPVDSLFDPQILWVGPAMSMTIQDGGGIQPAMAGGTTVRFARATTTTAAAVTPMRRIGRAIAASVGAPEEPAATSEASLRVDLDPDALPLVDRVGIDGPTAARLKDRVDDRVDALEAARRALADRLGNGALARALRQPVSDTEYVTLAYRELTGRTAGNKAMREAVDELGHGHLRVQVVEDIALTRHDAAWWMANA